MQKHLGKDRAMIEFVCLDNRFSAFVITAKKIDFVPDFAKESDILSLLEGLQFQFGALRYGAEKLAAFSSALKKRADFYLEKLFEKLLAPLLDLTGKSDVVIIPVSAAHYVPFQALRHDEKYLIETREINTSPSATVWQKLSEKPSEKIKNALLFGFADERIPLVDREIKSLQKYFDNRKFLPEKRRRFQITRKMLKITMFCISPVTDSFVPKIRCFRAFIWRTAGSPCGIFARSV